MATGHKRRWAMREDDETMYFLYSGLLVNVGRTDRAISTAQNKNSSCTVNRGVFTGEGYERDRTPSEARRRYQEILLVF